MEELNKIILALMLYLINTYPASLLINKITGKWRKQLEESETENDSLESAGLLIGILERILIVTFVLINQYEAVGLLIAAKSILRYNDKNKPEKKTEYVLIGTLMSFTYALLTSLLFRYFVFRLI
ncbi:MAG TPA: hypothetical protein DEP28_12660 [Bacteroidetes bacterium]|nr:hypothetical protein [Bacteroidota bacterium]HCN36299.1 hypothetical protein [Bacteroidota bacterium]